MHVVPSACCREQSHPRPPHLLSFGSPFRGHLFLRALLTDDNPPPPPRLPQSALFGSVTALSSSPCAPGEQVQAPLLHWAGGARLAEGPELGPQPHPSRPARPPRRGRVFSLGKRPLGAACAAGEARRKRDSRQTWAPGLAGRGMDASARHPLWSQGQGLVGSGSP